MTNDTSENWLENCLSRIGGARVGVLGDFCLDAYWLMDTDLDELSVETQLPVWRVRQQRYSPGGAANVAANLAALAVAEVRAVGLIGDDLYGGLMVEMLSGLGIDTDGLLRCGDGWQTMVFGKPYLGENEQSRIDFGGFNVVGNEAADALVAQLDRVAGECDVVILNQQVPGGTSPGHVIERLNAVIAAHPDCAFIADSRKRAEMYEGAMLKLNAHEAARLCSETRTLDEPVSGQEARGYAERLSGRTGLPVFVTRGEAGILVAADDMVHELPALEVLEQTDTVGAGDTVVAAIAAVIGSGGAPVTAARFANIAASVTVRKLCVTGTATPDEIRGLGPRPDYIYQTDLADSPRHATMIEGADFEVVRPLPEKLDIRYALFDHDGTVSVLRQGWEAIMEPVMVRSILGPRYDDAPEALYRKVVERSRDFIDKTTGIQTLIQMVGLVKMVREFGCVPEDQILDEYGYKAIYNEELLKMVHARIAKLGSGELGQSDYTMKNAPALLKALYDRGVKLYLLSGTDDEDVKAESAALGYADLFEGRIYGSVNDVKVEAKRDVLERIIRDNSLSGPQFVAFGDGPVEIREVHKRGGISVGVASDEVRRFGLNTVKRRRLIRAGADLIIPDFSQLDRLLEVLGV